MNINYLKYKIKLVRKVMYLLLEFLEPSNKYVVKCSQALDTLIVDFQRAAICANHKNSLKHSQKKYYHEIHLRKKYKRKKLKRVS